MLTADYAAKIARDWNVPASGAGFVTRFQVAPVSLTGQLIAHRSTRLKASIAASETLSITDIAFGWGFNSASHFARSFRDAFGMTPRDYRQRAQALTARSPPTFQSAQGMMPL